MYQLNEQETERLKLGIAAVFAIPFIDDLEDFIWEAIFAYTKGIPLFDPLANIRSKQLFDVIDQSSGIGWSVKALQVAVRPEREFELVIQRADIFKKSQLLGFDKLSLNSPPEILGEALLKHWQLKVEIDSLAQGITDKRICILLKSKNRQEYAFYEDNLALYEIDDLVWQWTDDTMTGLQGLRRNDNFCVYRWYPNQKQLFERFKLPSEALIFRVNPRRLPIEVMIRLIQGHLDRF